MTTFDIKVGIIMLRIIHWVNHCNFNFEAGPFWDNNNYDISDGDVHFGIFWLKTRTYIS